MFAIGSSTRLCIVTKYFQDEYLFILQLSRLFLTGNQDEQPTFNDFPRITQVSFYEDYGF